MTQNYGNPNIAGYASLGADINKSKGGDPIDETIQGVVSDELPDLTFKMSDDDLSKLTNKWEKIWKDSSVRSKWIEQIEENEKYWLGEQFEGIKADKSRPMVDNLIFESLETFLPQATRRNPEPLITLESFEESDESKEKYIEKVKIKLADLADKNKLRLKLKKVTRHWSIYQLGIGKFGWDLDNDMPIIRIIRPKIIILDPKSTIDEDGYTGNYIGEYRKLEASKILAIVKTAKAKKLITDLIKGDDNAEIKFIEWWTPMYTCWTINGEVLKKDKNPNWNYEDEERVENIDEFGGITTESIEPINHFSTPQMPYIFLSVFNLGDQPMDRTSLIGQNLANQDIINKRNKQIDKNVDKHNGGLVVSLGRSGLTQSQARGVSKTLREGGVVGIPDGSPRDAIEQYNPSSLASDVFNQLYDTRARMRDIFGVKGSSQAGLETEQTVRGKIISRGLDTDRIGGGVTEYLEQFADDGYNWFVQLLYVYDSNFRFIAGSKPPKILVSVKEGSLLPKDSSSIANQALELARLNRISNLDLYKRLEWPNPEELAANVWLQENAPHIMFKENLLIQEALNLQQVAKSGIMNNEQVSPGGFREFEAESPNKSILSEVPQNINI